MAHISGGVWDSFPPQKGQSLMWLYLVVSRKSDGRAARSVDMITQRSWRGSYLISGISISFSSLNHSAIRNDRIFGDDNVSVTNHVIFSIFVVDISGIDELDPIPYSHILIYEGVAYLAVFTNSDIGNDLSAEILESSVG